VVVHLMTLETVLKGIVLNVRSLSLLMSFIIIRIGVVVSMLSVKVVGRLSTLVKLKAKYGVTWENYLEVLEYQDYKCAICQRDISSGGNRSEKNNCGHIDHDHKNSRLRGILCADCNTGLGCFKDSIESLRSAIKYLEIFSV
jgi:DNA-directed RNA polymerase subunit RPC12/RpoP